MLKSVCKPNICRYFPFFFCWLSKNCIRNGERMPAIGISLLSARVRSLPHQISLLCQSLEIWKYICQLKMENMSKRTEWKIKEAREKKKHKYAGHFTMYIKNIFSKLFIAVDTAKLCKNCLSYEQHIAKYSFIRPVYDVGWYYHTIPATHAPSNTIL